MSHHQPTPSHLPPVKSELAVVSLVLGIASFIVWILASLAAIIFGHLALSKIRKSGGRLDGRGLALAGLTCGYITLLIGTVVLGSFIFQGVKERREMTEQITKDTQNAESIYQALKKYEVDQGKFPDRLSDLEKTELLPSLADLQPIQGGNWNYYPGQSSRDLAKDLLLWAPHTDITLRIDGSIKRVDNYHRDMHARSRMRDIDAIQE